MTELVCLLDGHEVGRVGRSIGRLRFTYAEAWRRGGGPYPLSLSMSMAANLPDALSDEIKSAKNRGLDRPVLDRLGIVLVERARHLAAL